MLLTMYLVRNLLCLVKPGLGTLAVGTVFTQGLSATMDVGQYRYKGGTACEALRGGFSLWRLERVCPESAFTSPSTCFLQGPVGPEIGRAHV